MDDGLILNLAEDSYAPSAKTHHAKKGGRWTDRLKAKRGAKRKTRTDDTPAASDTPRVEGIERRPSKRARNESTVSTERKNVEETALPTPRPPTQIISSLFTSNPKLEQPLPSTQHHHPEKPSNAPLRDSSTFAGLGLDPLIIAHLESKMNIQKPTSIQRAALPILLSEDHTSRDVFIQSQTGSGKTLSFLLPIIQDLLPLSSLSYIDRSIGTLAIIIAPTRELAKQISDVLEALLKMRLRPADESADDTSATPRLTRWLVSGLLSGGSTRTHEKARLRKGVPILVSTPGRLLDHLQNTSSFNVGKCRWLVLDEADRLMDLGFEETISGIVKGLEGRRKLAMQAAEEGKSMEVRGWDWTKRLRTILCSATIRDDVQKLAGTTLANPIVVKALQDESSGSQLSGGDSLGEVVSGNTKFTPPSQLAQKYVVVPLKLRLVTLVALLRSLLAQSQGRRGTKIIVFLSCTDSVDFHWQLLGGTSMDGDDAEPAPSETEEDDEEVAPSDHDEEEGGEVPPKHRKKSAKQNGEKIALSSPLLPDTSIYRLHGSLPLQTRLASLKGFSSVPSDKSKSSVPSTSSSILLCTSVASRGLDLPLVRAVIQYDLPTEGGATEYVHRVGRTARVGKGGEAWSFVAPSEAEWVKWVTEKMQGGAEDEDSKKVGLEAVAVESVLKKGFGGKGTEYEERATDVQLSFERWVLRDQQHAEWARKAFLAHIRAYATHPSDEKHIFHVRHLHLGHLAKAFALREAPSAVTNKSHPKAKGKTAAGKPRKIRGKGKKADDSDDDFDVADAEKRMEMVVRAQGRLTKKAGKMVSTGASEFQVAGGDALEALVNSAPS
ncbi:DEAD-domain-containing protein [Panus rudis PR-1116 ss-1]|nr:DEAD-domain-containing protein [Panus rudis PR-1116 ss-1]